MTDRSKTKPADESQPGLQWNGPRDEFAAETQDSDFYGPVLLTRYEVNPQGSIFYVNDPAKLPERAVAVRVAPQDTTLLNLMTFAYSSGKAVMVAPANRWWLGNNILAWTIWAAKIQ